MKAVNIIWDTDGDDELRKELPRTIQIPDEMIAEDGTVDEDEIADYLSNQTGFCHFSYYLVDDDGKYINNGTSGLGVKVDENGNFIQNK